MYKYLRINNKVLILDIISDSMVCDLGSGCGVLSIGSVLVGANFVIGFEIDSDAIQVAKNNIEQILDEPSMSSIEFIQINLQTQLKMLSRFKNTFDVVSSTAQLSCLFIFIWLLNGLKSMLSVFGPNH